MRAVAGEAGGGVGWIPDGETGERGTWVRQHERRFREIDGLDERARETPPVDGRVHWRATVPEYAVRPGADVRIATFGYAAAARASYEIFARLQLDGTI